MPRCHENHRRLRREWIHTGILMLAGFLLLSGCPRKGSGLQLPDSRPSSSLVNQIEKIRQNRTSIQSMEGRAKLRVYHANGRRSTYRLFFQLQRPNRLHFSITVAMQPVVIATSDGQHCALFQLTEKTFWHGPASHLPRMLGDFLPPHIPIEQLVPILFGEMPVLSGQPTQTDTQPSNGIQQWDIQHKQYTQTLWIDSSKQQFIKTKLSYQKKSPLLLEYGTFRGHPSLPKRVIFESPQEKQKVVWIFSDYTINPTIPLHSFQQKNPKDTAIKIRPL